MKKLFSSGLVAFAGMVSVPFPVAKLAHTTPAPDYRNDPRLACLRYFFTKSDCPAWKYSAVFLEAADAYDLDWRLLPSISFVESTGGKSARNNNLFGWDSGRAQFSSPSAGIHKVGYHLSHSGLYRHKNLDAVLATYNSSEEYGAKVKSVMRRISASE
jgi:Mannosyl-glycoprotein endo-beta-N-acetylglucosaminidase